MLDRSDISLAVVLRCSKKKSEEILERLEEDNSINIVFVKRATGKLWIETGVQA